MDSEAVVDGMIMSARAWLDHASWMREFIRLLKQKAPMGEGEAAVTR
jgi:protease I